MTTEAQLVHGEATSRSLRQEEIDGYWRQDFINEVEDWTKNGKVAEFAVTGKSNKPWLVKIERAQKGEWEFSVSGKGSWYAYRYSNFISFLENIWDKAKVITCFEGEFQYKLNKPAANPDAEPSQEEHVQDKAWREQL